MRKSLLLSILPVFGLLIASNQSYGQYCASRANSTADSKCDEVELKGASITLKNNTSVGCASYSDFTNLPAPDILAGLQYEVSITAGTCGGNYTKRCNAWIDFNQNGVFDHPAEVLGPVNGSPGNSSTHTVTFQFTVPIDAKPGITRLRAMVIESSGNVNNPCATYTWGETEDYNVNVLVQFDNDATMSDLSSPGIPVCNPLDSTFEAVIENPGKLDLDSCMVNWMVNDSLMTPFKFTGPISTGMTGTATSYFYRSFVIGDTIKVWTSMPNGLRDSLAINDTINYVLVNGLSGTYTVGGSFADFANIDSAIKSVNRQGICGHVIFELNDGSHTPTLKLQDFYGSSANSTLTFTSASNDRTKCFITDTSSSGSNAFAMELDGADWIIFKEVSLTNAGTSANAGVLSLEGEIEGLHIEDCHFMNHYNGTSARGALVYGDEVNIDGFELVNCDLDSGAYGIYIIGLEAQPSMDLDFSDLEIMNQRVGSIYLEYVGDVVIEDNNMMSNSTYGSGVAISLNGTSSNMNISRNVVTGTADWPITALSVVEGAGNNNSVRHVVNNIFTLGDTSSTDDYMAITLHESIFWTLAHNTVVVNGGSSDAYALEINDGSGNEVVNNILAVFGAGKVVYYEEPGSVAGSDGNLLYTETGATLGDYLGSNYIDLRNWSSNTGFDSRMSASADPQFYDRYMRDYRLCSPDADNIGHPIGIARDYTGAPRDPMHPDPGAYEFASVQGFSVDDDQICDGDTAIFSATVGANDTVVWNGSDSSTQFMTSTGGTYTVEAFGFCGSVKDTFTVGINMPVSLAMDHNLCAGEDTTISANLSNASYMWNDGSMSQSKMVNKTGQYYVAVTDSDGCMSSDTVNITVSTEAVLPMDQTVCENQTVSLDPGTGAGTYQWTRNGSTISSASKIFADSAGTYVVSYTDQYSCVSMDTVVITHDEAPFATFTVTPRSALTQNNFEFTADYKKGTNYYWSFGDGKSVNGNAWKTVNVYSQNGSYTVTLTVSSMACGDSTFRRTVIIEGVGLDEASLNSEIKMYPNPTSGILNLDFGSLNSEDFSVSVINASGQEVMIEQNAINTIDMSSFDKGLYIVKVSKDSEVVGIRRISVTQ